MEGVGGEGGEKEEILCWCWFVGVLGFLSIGVEGV